MDFCYVWLRRLVGRSVPQFSPASTRNQGELTANENMGRGLVNFTEGLSPVFNKMAAALKMGAPLAFTYHHKWNEVIHLRYGVCLPINGQTSGQMDCEFARRSGRLGSRGHR